MPAARSTIAWQRMGGSLVTLTLTLALAPRLSNLPTTHLALRSLAATST